MRIEIIEPLEKLRVVVEANDADVAMDVTWTASIPAFPVEQRYVTEIDGKPCDTYIDWFAITFILTLTACPVLSIPCGFTADGLPVGLQLVGKPRGEAALLRAGAWIEAQLGIAQRLPIDPMPSTI